MLKLSTQQQKPMKPISFWTQEIVANNFNYKQITQNKKFPFKLPYNKIWYHNSKASIFHSIYFLVIKTQNTKQKQKQKHTFLKFWAQWPNLHYFHPKLKGKTN